LTSEMIEMISQAHEDEIGDMLYNEGLCLESMETGKNIIYADVDNDEMNWSVKSMWKTEREFKTLKGAIKFCQKQ
jgi:hypothetical protein